MLLHSTLNRRSFVSRAASAAGAAWSWRPVTAGTDEEPKPLFTVALPSDTHLGRVKENDVELMRQVVAEINASNAECTIFCGDLVNAGQLPENEHRYPEWLELASSLKRDHFAVAGNHDPDSLFLKHLRKETDYSFSLKDHRFVCFRNAEPNPGHMGVVTPEQLRWLDGELQQAGTQHQRVILIAHVTHHRNQHPDVGWYITEGREAFQKLLETHRHIVAMFGGHFHCGLRGWTDTAALPDRELAQGVVEVILPSVSYNRNRGLKDAPGFKLDEYRSGFTLVDVFPDKLTLRYKPLGINEFASCDVALRMSPSSP